MRRFCCSSSLRASAPNPEQMDVVDITSPPPSPGRASETAQLQEVDGVVMLDSDEPAAGAVYDNNVKKLAKRPVAAMEDKPHWALPNVVRSGESPLE